MPAHIPPFLRHLAPYALVLLGAAIGVGAYLQALDYPFISDDVYYISSNSRLAKLQLSELWRLFVEPYNAMYEFLPLRELSYWLDMTLFGSKPPVFRIHNIVLYLLSLPLIYAATSGLWRYFRPADTASISWAAAATTALFALHPTLVESVVWASGRKYMLSNLFSILALWLAVSAKRESGLSPAYTSATLIAFAAMMLSKTSYVTVAPVIALLWLFFWHDIPAPQRRRSSLLWPLAILSLAAAIVVAFIASSSLFIHKGEIPFYFGIEAITRILAVLGWLTRLAISPENRHFFYPVFEDPWLPAMVTLGVATLAATLWGVVITLRKRSLEGFALAAFILLCLPYLQLIPYTPPSLVSDRFLSLAVWPAILLIIALAWRLKPAPRILMLLAIMLSWGVQTIERPRDWRSLEAMADSDLRAYPGQYFASYNKIVNIQIPRGQTDEAIDTANSISPPEIRNIMIDLIQTDYAVRIKTALTGTPDEATALLVNLGLKLEHPPAQAKWNSPLLNVWSEVQNTFVFEWGYLAAHFPNDAMVRYNAGLCMLNDHQYKNAVAHFRAAIGSPYLPEPMRKTAFKNIGLALMGAGRINEAEAPLQAALEQPSPDLQVYCLLSEVYKRTKRIEEAARIETYCRK